MKTPDMVPNPAEAGVVGWRVRLIDWASEETFRVIPCGSQLEAEEAATAEREDLPDGMYIEVSDEPRMFPVPAKREYRKEDYAKAKYTSWVSGREIHGDDPCIPERRIGDIYGYFGPLYVRENKAAFEWALESDDGYFWEEIPKYLYDALVRFDDETAQAKKEHRDEDA